MRLGQELRTEDRKPSQGQGRGPTSQQAGEAAGGVCPRSGPGCPTPQGGAGSPSRLHPARRVRLGVERGRWDDFPQASWCPGLCPLNVPAGKGSDPRGLGEGGQWCPAPGAVRGVPAARQGPPGEGERSGVEAGGVITGRSVFLPHRLKFKIPGPWAVVKTICAGPGGQHE